MLLVAAIFIGAMFAAAIAAALLASLFVLLMGGFVAFGIISTSLVVAVCRRSLASGFKTFLLIGLGLSCTLFGGLSGLLSNSLFSTGLSSEAVSTTGAAAGMLTGIILALGTYKLLSLTLARLLKRFSPTVEKLSLPQLLRPPLLLSCGHCA